MALSVTEVLVFVDRREVARHPLGIGTHTFGSSAECSIQIEAAHLSRQHAQITVEEDGSLLLEDLGSTNGTFLDGFRITAPTPFDPDQSIQIGTASLLLRQEAANAGDGDGLPPELTQVIRYEPGAEIAKGGMGAILAARQPSIRREVALKVMLRNASGHDRLRFIEEAQITGQLEHPNIVPVHDLALNEHGQPYYTMKLVKGSTLRDVLKLLTAGDPASIAKYSLAALVTTFQKICDAVAFAHARGVIHRDLKPANIMVGEFGEVLVMDWGLAKVLRPVQSPASGTPAVSSAREDQRDVFATLDGAVMGTPHYMSPEQAVGEVATLDQRSDIFSLGAILYELVTLVPPFSGQTTRDVLAQLQQGSCLLPNARLRAAGRAGPNHLRGGAIPDSLEAVIMKALAPDRNQRYQRVEDFQADLTAYQNGFATSAEKAGPWRQLKLFVARHRAVTGVAAAAALLLSGFGVASLLRIARERDVAQQQRQLAQEQRQRAEEQSRRATDASEARLKLLEEAALSDRLQAMRLWEDGDASGAVAHLERALRYLPSSSILAEVAFPMVANSGVEFPRMTFSLGARAATNAVFDPQGAKILITFLGDTARLFSAPGGTLVREFRAPGNRGRIVAASFSTSGPRILISRGQAELEVFDVESGLAVARIATPGKIAWRGRFSPDGSRVFFLCGDRSSEGGAAGVWDLRQRKLLPGFRENIAYLQSAVFSKDGTRLLVASDVGKVRLWNCDTGELIREFTGKTNTVEQAAFSSDEKRIVTAPISSVAQIWDVASGTLLAEFKGHRSPLSDAAFSPDDRWIVTAAGDHTARVWNVQNPGQFIELKGHGSFLRNAAFSADGNQIVTASQDGTVRLWDARTGRQLAELRGPAKGITQIALSGAGQVLAVAEDGTARLWDLPRSQGRLDFLGSEDPALSPDGERVLTFPTSNSADIRNSHTGKFMARIQSDTGEMVVAEFTPDSRRILTVSADATFRTWDAQTGRQLTRYQANTKAFERAAVSAAGTLVITGSDDQTARIWDASSGRLLHELTGHPEGIWGVDFSPDGRQAVTIGERGPVYLWDVATGARLREFGGEGENHVAVISPDGLKLATAANGVNGALLWDVASGKELLEFKSPAPVRTLTFSPDGSRVLGACRYRLVKLWDAATGAELTSYVGHTDEVNCAAFNVDGSRVLTGADDGTVRLWETTTGAPLAITRTGSRVATTAFYPDGRHFLGGTTCWDLLQPGDTPPAWFGQFLAELGGQRFGPDGRLQSAGALEQWSDALRAIAAQPGDNDFLRLLRWRLKPASERATPPFTVVEQ